MADLNELIEWSSVECLNQKPDHTIQNALKQAGCSAALRRRGGWEPARLPRRTAPNAAAQQPLQGYREDDGLYLESDTDEQLL